MKEFIMILLELVKLLDRLLDLDEQQLDICTYAQHKYITDFRNFIAMFANRLQRKDDGEQPLQQEKVTLAECLLTEEVDTDDEGADLYIRRRNKLDRELC